MYKTTRPDEEGYFRDFTSITYQDEYGEFVTVANAGDTSDDGSLLMIVGALTLAQLHELTHKLTQIIAPGVTDRQTATWATAETLGAPESDEDEVSDVG